MEPMSVFVVSCEVCGFSAELEATDRNDAVVQATPTHKNAERGMICRCDGEPGNLKATPIPKFSCD
jgi:hypothetical protein